MTEFRTLETFAVKGRGVGHVVANPVARSEDELIREFVGTTVLLDGVERKVLAMESWLVPGLTVPAGAPIVFVFAEAVAEAMRK